MREGGLFRTEVVCSMRGNGIGNMLGDVVLALQRQFRLALRRDERDDVGIDAKARAGDF